MKIIHANTKQDYEAAAALFKEYAQWLNIDLCFQGFDEELLHLEEMYALPYGAIFLAKENDLFSGSVAVRKKENGIAELKRMYIRPAFRKQGIAELLLNEALGFAKNAGYEKIRLDTLASMVPAMSLYKKAGFYEIDPYCFNPEKNAVFFEKAL